MTDAEFVRDVARERPAGRVVGRARGAGVVRRPVVGAAGDGHIARPREIPRRAG